MYADTNVFLCVCIHMYVHHTQDMTVQITWTEGGLDTYTFPCLYIKICANTCMCTYVYMHTQEMTVQSAPTESGLDVYACLYMYVNICKYIHIYIRIRTDRK